MARAPRRASCVSGSTRLRPLLEAVANAILLSRVRVPAQPPHVHHDQNDVHICSSFEMADDHTEETDAVSRGGAQRLGRPPRAAIASLLGLLLLVNLAASLYQLPLNLVIERRLCLEYYRQHDPSQIGHDGNIAESLCKVDEVQQGLGWIQGTMDTIWVVGGTHICLKAILCLVATLAHRFDRLHHDYPAGLCR